MPNSTRRDGSGTSRWSKTGTADSTRRSGRASVATSVASGTPKIQGGCPAERTHSTTRRTRSRAPGERGSTRAATGQRHRFGPGSANSGAGSVRSRRPPRMTTAELRTMGALASRQVADSPNGLGGAYTWPR
ncbi:hypothetical protein SZN_12843 [Streptomyces zinciresistens K42]|uniref:Uncharacterized protein n=1 Tax=Streptomyces zinciresistens K42 TaxID=700597 RepID=G2GAQ1_9ACTN|nr:hypothetical protein SZN_12843 [Streptomyces zinciresistens K42]